MGYKISHHAQEEMQRRGISEASVKAVLSNPQQIVDEYGNKKAFQSKIDFGSGKIYLVRVIVDDTVSPISVVTVYRTSRIEKYWRKL